MKPGRKTPRLAISQELWEPGDQPLVLPVLRALGVEGLILSPERMVPGYAQGRTGTEEVVTFCRLLDGLGLEPVALQSVIPAGSPGRIFSTKERQKELLDQMARAIELARAAKVTSLVFSAPHLRNGSFFSNQRDFDTAVDFFSRLSRLAADQGCRVMLTPCPEEYGCDFGTTLEEMAVLVSELTHNEGVGVHLSACSLLHEGGMRSVSMTALGGGAPHMDVSDTFDRPVIDPESADHANLAKALSRMITMGSAPTWVAASGRTSPSNRKINAISEITQVIGAVSSLYLSQDGCLA